MFTAFVTALNVTKYPWAHLGVETKFSYYMWLTSDLKLKYITVKTYIHSTAAAVDLR